MLTQKTRMYGQVFLTDQLIALEIVSALQIGAKDIILEIGIGDGILTNIILKQQFGEFYIIEIDKELCDKHGLINDRSNVSLILGDATNFPINNLQPTKVISNLPYSCAKKILENIIIYADKVEEIVFMIQEEVGQSILDHNTIFGCLFSSFYECIKVLHVDKKHFKPIPKVQSLVLKATKIKNCNLNLTHYKQFLCKFFSINNKKLKALQDMHGFIVPAEFHGYRTHQLKIAEIVDIYRLNS